MKTQGHAQKHSPKHHAEPSEHEQAQAQHDEGNVIILGEPDVVTIFDHVRSIALQCGLVVVLCRAR